MSGLSLVRGTRKQLCGVGSSVFLLSVVLLKAVR